MVARHSGDMTLEEVLLLKKDAFKLQPTWRNSAGTGVDWSVATPLLRLLSITQLHKHDWVPEFSPKFPEGDEYEKYLHEFFFSVLICTIHFDLWGAFPAQNARFRPCNPLSCSKSNDTPFQHPNLAIRARLQLVGKDILHPKCQWPFHTPRNVQNQVDLIDSFILGNPSLYNYFTQLRSIGKRHLDPDSHLAIISSKLGWMWGSDGIESRTQNNQVPKCLPPLLLLTKLPKNAARKKKNPPAAKNVASV